MQIVVKLKDVIIDPADPVDLAAMPAEKAIALIRKAYGFLAANMTFEIHDGSVVITVDEETREDEATAKECFEQGMKQAGAGRYNKAVNLFTRVLDIVPEQTEARRNLAMALVNAGRMSEAKDQLIDVLRLSPEDIWAYVLLGNIYAKHENNLEAGERFYRKALELDPREARALINYAALKIEREEHEGAQELFEQAIATDPKLPNAYYGLAMLLNQTDKQVEALATLERMFDGAEWGDVRTAELRNECREFYLRLSAQISEAGYTTCWKAVQSLRHEIAQGTGFPVELIEDNSLEDTTAMSIPAWQGTGTGESVVRYNSRGKAVIPHIVGRELVAIRLEHEALQAGKACGLHYAKDNAERTRVVDAHVRRLERRGAGLDARDIVVKVTDTLMPRLLLSPIDAILESVLWTRQAALRSSQTVGLYLHARQKRNPLDQPQVTRALPVPVQRAHETAAAAWALFIDKMCGGRTAYAAEYARCEGLPLARELAEAWQTVAMNIRPGDEYGLVRQFVEAMRLDAWMGITSVARP